MVNATAAGNSLLTCDAAIKQFILHIDDELQSTQRQPQSFVIKDLDATHILVKTEVVDHIQKKIMELQVARLRTLRLTRCV
jgi:hypothetical protein